jgi:hypothetical protein
MSQAKIAAARLRYCDYGADGQERIERGDAHAALHLFDHIQFDLSSYLVIETGR